MDKLNEIQNLYKEYYSYAIKNDLLEVPEGIEYREFGYGYFKKVDNRNISFKDEEEYKNWVLKNAPFHLYKSLSYMEFPDKSGGANKKKVFRREIAFDIDVHKTNKCRHSDDWVCDKCLNAAKEQAIYLIEEFLMPDFGLSKEDLQIAFSGNRGYHIYIKPKDEEIRNIIEHYEKPQRRFFIEYILGKNLNLNKVGSGWRRRLVKEFKKKRIATKQFEKEENWKKIIEKRKNKDKIYSIINETLNKLELDEKVMDDDIRLLRVINSLHGYTGFIVKEIKYKELDNFNPLKDAIFNGFNKKFYNVKIKQKVDKINIGDEIYSTKSKEIPASVLLFLFGHGVDFEIIG
ncbi:DNA primase catalytic subunit PriS [Methanotorris igneus]|uniref:DNA primase small subunit PriS n=1 Tax=Methanotorris igneus (strain DSM 5666 / JCM 11834 / Kol 5) TaxID=880724 RepID=F6BDY9_METIK|nr:DNA primase catalytic subunit PriS [Methanotorris igneus]AEF96700.1 DNA primase small subunit [Methanotorris igneus Kol 5]